MAKNDLTTQGTLTAPGTLDANAQALIHALTAAIVSRRNEPPPNQEAGQAADQYTLIKSALRTHAEGLHGSQVPFARRNSKG